MKGEDEMERKNLRIAVAAAVGVLTVLTLGIVACLISGVGLYRFTQKSPGSSAGVVGTYVNQDYPGQYLELKSDGTFYSRTDMGYEGDWELSDDELTLHYSELGLACKCRLEGETLVGDDGQTLVKTSPVSPDELVGTWERAGSAGDDIVAMEFSKDGSLRLADPDGEYTGTYEFFGVNGVEMHVPDVYGWSKLAMIEISRNKLTLTLLPAEESHTFRRAR
jgi:hypothetical protein